MPVRPSEIVEAMLGDEDPNERAYAQLKDLHGQRQRLQSERMFRASWAMTLHRLGYKESDLASLDIRSESSGCRYVVGLVLKKGDYKGKIDRAAKMRKELTSTVGAPTPRTPARGFGGTTPTAYYVPVIPPLYIPEHLGDDFNPRQ
jgi:hypothetical protein